MDEADDDKYSLIPEKEIYYYIGVSKEDAKKLIQDHADIPHIKINGTNYDLLIGNVLIFFLVQTYHLFALV